MDSARIKHTLGAETFLCIRGIKESLFCIVPLLVVKNEFSLIILSVHASWLDKDEIAKHSPKPNIHQKKLMVSAWWSSHGLIHYSFIKPGQSITAETYCNQLDNVIKNLAEKLPRLVNRDRRIHLLYMIMIAHTLQIGRN